jgi:hypothetical protein
MTLNLDRNKRFIPGAVSASGSRMTHLWRMLASAIRIMSPVRAA